MRRRSSLIAPRSSRSRPLRLFRFRASGLRPPASSLRSRRGVLLLVVLSLLVLFLMVGTAFIVAAKLSQNASKASAKAESNFVSEAARGSLLDDALLQLLRDTDNPTSALRSHSLLADLYGNDGFTATIDFSQWAKANSVVDTNPNTGVPGDTSAPVGGVTRGQLMQFDVLGPAEDIYGQPVELSRLDDAYNGLLVTFLSSSPRASAKGITTRIVDSQVIPLTSPPNAVKWRFTVMAFPLADGSLIDNPNLTPTQDGPHFLNGSRILVNGRPFNGTGVGYNPLATGDEPRLNEQEIIPGVTVYLPLPTPLALLPNTAFFDIPDPANLAMTSVGEEYYGTATFNAGHRPYWGRGGADESYDAPDFQNMFMALVTDEADDYDDDLKAYFATVVGTASPDGLEDQVLPSFHRPELINYWARQTAFSTSSDVRQSTLGDFPNAVLLRKILLRPNWFDHPNFTGSNAELAESPDNGTKLAHMIYGPWDVDNDNDGVRDSIWVDFGAPVIMGPHGRLVKPLVAMLVVDMDGRININTAGTRDTVDFARLSGAQNPVISGSVRLAEGLPPFDNTPGAQRPNTPRGMGWGPAEISAVAAIGAGSSEKLVGGGSVPSAGVSHFLPGKYGTDDQANPTPNSARPGRTVPGVGGAPIYDLMAQIEFFGWPQWGTWGGTSFGSPPDLRARYGNGVNDYGQQVIEATLNSELPSPTGPGQLLADSPYETNFFAEGSDTNNGRTALDAPFSVAELERILREYDTDGYTLPGRLDVLRNLDGPAERVERNQITTESWSVEGPLVSLPHEMEPLLAPLTAVDPVTSQPYRRLPRSSAELFEMRVRAALAANPPQTPNPPRAAADFPLFPEPIVIPLAIDDVRRVMRQLLAPELAAGLRLNINRPLGNGRDDNLASEPGFGVVDEPGEDSVTTPRTLWQAATIPNAEVLDPNFLNAKFTPLDANGDGAADDVDAALQRQLLARHLYVLALTTTAEATYVGTSQAEILQARRLAQWAINAVDFRDADAIMTPFEYDLNPFDGWDVNGLVGDEAPGPDAIPGTTDDVPVTPVDDDLPIRGVVWGTERPELVMTETMAWHNRNTTDEANEDPNPAPGGGPGEMEVEAPSDDPLNEPGGEFDQRYRPRGAFFLEVYNPWPANPAVSGDLHRVVGGNDMGVDLSAVDRHTSTSPVWRLMIYRDVDLNKDPDAEEPGDRPLNLDRSVYFAKINPHDIDPNDGVEFFRDPVAIDLPAVRPGRYMVVGSGLEDPARPGVYIAPLGSLKDKIPAEQLQLRRMEMDTNVNALTTIRLVGDNDVTAVQRDPMPPNPPDPIDTPFAMEAPREGLDELPRLAGDASQCIADVAVIDQSVNNLGAMVPRRLTLSEPARGYPNRVGNCEFVFQSNDPNEEGEYYFGGNVATPKPVDTPLDDDPVTGDPALRDLGVKYPYRRIFLQRLANPLVPFDAVANPYRTVDSTFANLTVFNGRNDGEYDQTVNNNSKAQPGFSSVQRGQIQSQREDEDDRDYNLWAYERPDMQGPNPLGTIEVQNNPTDKNRIRAGFTDGATDQIFNLMPRLTLGFLNKPFMEPNEVDTQMNPLKRVLPDEPFPWLAWNNRPYVSANELLLVPRGRSYRLLSSFSMADDDHDASPYNEAVFDQPVDPANLNVPDSAPFTHLENFFFDEEPAGGNDQPSHLYRVLEYVQTPSLFTGATTWLNPLMTAPTTPPSTIAADDPRAALQPPFNNVSSFREPGRINLNTVFSPAVYAGLFHDENADASDVRPEGDDSVHPGPEWDNFLESRRGYGGGDLLALDKDLPTFFVNPFRASGAANLVPRAEMVQRDGAPTEVRGVECTLFRSDDEDADSLAGDAEPRLAGEADDNHDDAERNAFFHFAPMTRLNNLVSTQSNVYAVWITVGFFEVEPAPSETEFGADNPGITGTALTQLHERVYPDGYAFTKEDGLEDGDVRRMRGFYIIDRSRPAAFLPGVDVNVENTIRLHRRIE